MLVYGHVSVSIQILFSLFLLPEKLILGKKHVKSSMKNSSFEKIKVVRIH